MKRILSVICLSGLMFTSCDSNSSKDDSSVIDSSVIPPATLAPVKGPDTINPATPVSINQPTQVNPQQQAVPVNLNGSAVTQTIPAAQNVTTIPTATTTTAPGMNPPHGQPNHRCDIAVGAPLNSKPNQQPVVTQQAIAPQQTVTAPGMNPPHGQPNHRCDIAVGAPLNSKPVPVTTTPQVVTPVVQEAVKKDSIGKQ